MSKRNPVFLFAFLLGAFSFALAQSSMGDLSNDAQQVDCSDPANSAMAVCQTGYGQTQNNTNQTNPNNRVNNGGYRPQNGQNGPSQNGRSFSDNGGVNQNPSQNPLLNPFIPAPREPLTEFQRLVAAATGQVLPIFGYELFRSVPSTFAPLDAIPVTSDYVIGPGDELRIRVWGQVNFNADLKVDRSGDVYLPQVGQMHVSGLPYSGLSAALRSQISRVFRNFDLTVELGQLRSIQIFVVGQARRPGSYTVSSLSTLVNALFASGGPSVEGTMRDIQLKRGGEVVTHFDIYDLLINGDKSKDARLLPGDVIFIPAVGPRVALTGSVREPAIYELSSGPDAKTSVQQVIDDAGGLSALASGSRISIERIQGREARQAMEVALDPAGLAMPLHDGDVIRVLSIAPRYQQTVTLRGNLANPGRFSWHTGMKLSDLIPDRESLITRNYWWRRTQLGLPSPEFQPLDRVPGYQPRHPVDVPRQRQNVNGTQQNYPNQQNPQNPQNPQNANQNGYQNNQPTDNTYDNYNSNTNPQYPVNADGTPAPNAQYGNQNLNGSPQNQRTTAMPAQAEASGSTLAGQQNQVITQNIAAADQKVDVKLSAPEIDWSYAVIERLNAQTLKTSLLPFNLGKLVLDHDPTQDIALEPGDVVTIFSQADIRVPIEQQTKFVHLEGEFASAGTYSVQPGETLRHLVQRAGGFTPDAYLFGSEFTRESTRVFQQQRLDEYIQSLELQIQRSGLTLAANAVSGQDTAAANAASISQQGLLSRLHRLRASGRIVLEVKPNSAGVDSIPDLQLQDDDRFIVPSRPASVNVVGAVYDQNSFIYQPNRRVGDYLRLAGGPSRDADKKHIFVIRADGSVISRDSSSGLWGNTFESARLNPGDAIIVPEKVVGSSVLKGFLNWSQVFSQLAFGAAAIRVL